MPELSSLFARRPSTPIPVLLALLGASACRSADSLAESTDVALEQATVAAADEGDPESQFRLGLAHARGEGVEADDERASYWYERAATRGAIRQPLLERIAGEMQRSRA